MTSIEVSGTNNLPDGIGHVSKRQVEIIYLMQNTSSVKQFLVALIVLSSHASPSWCGNEYPLQVGAGQLSHWCYSQVRTGNKLPNTSPKIKNKTPMDWAGSGIRAYNSSKYSLSYCT